MNVIARRRAARRDVSIEPLTDADFRLVESANRAVKAAPELSEAIHDLTMSVLFQPRMGDACPRCDGKGTIERTPGDYSTRILCPKCRGTGRRGGR